MAGEVTHVADDLDPVAERLRLSHEALHGSGVGLPQELRGEQDAHAGHQQLPERYAVPARHATGRSVGVDSSSG